MANSHLRHNFNSTVELSCVPLASWVWISYNLSKEWKVKRSFHLTQCTLKRWVRSFRQLRSLCYVRCVSLIRCVEWKPRLMTKKGPAKPLGLCFHSAVTEAKTTDMRQHASSSHRWSLTTYDAENPLHRCSVQHCVYELSFDDRSRQFSRHVRRIENDFLPLYSPLYSYIFCTHNRNHYKPNSRTKMHICVIGLR